MTSNRRSFPFLSGWLGRRGRRFWVAIPVGRVGMHLEMGGTNDV